MRKHPVVAVDGAEHALEHCLAGVALCLQHGVALKPLPPLPGFGHAHRVVGMAEDQPLKPAQPQPQRPDAPLTDQAVIGVNDTTQKVDTLAAALQDGFSRVQLKVQVVAQKARDLSLPANKGLRVVGQQHKVVYIPQVGAHLELMLHKLVQLVEIDIGKELAGVAANGQAYARRCAQQRFVRGNARQQCGVATAHWRWLGGVLGDDGGGHLVKARANRLRPRQLRQRFAPQAQQYRAVNAREECPYVQVAVPALAALPHEVLQAAHGGLRSFAGAVGKAVVDEAFVPPGFDMADEPLVYQTVSKSRRKDFTQFGVRYDKYRERLRLISALRDGASQAQNDVWQDHEVRALVFAVASIGRTGEELPGQVLDVCDVGCAQVRCFGLGG